MGHAPLPQGKGAVCVVKRTVPVRVGPLSSPFELYLRLVVQLSPSVPRVRSLRTRTAARPEGTAAQAALPSVRTTPAQVVPLLANGPLLLAGEYGIRLAVGVPWLLTVMADIATSDP